MWGHEEDLCYGHCKYCLGWEHDPKLCSKNWEVNTLEEFQDKIKAKKAKTKAIKKAKKAKAKKLAESTKANFNLTLPEGYENSSDDSKT